MPTLQPPKSDYSQQLAEDGYCIIPKVVDPASLDALRERIDAALRSTDAADPLDAHFLPHRPEAGVLYDVAQRYPEFLPLAYHREIVSAATAILGPDIYLYVNSVVTKTAGAQGEVPWHQDFLSRKDESPKLISWIALDPVGSEDGPLLVLPGEHKKGFLPWSFHPGEVHHSRLDTNGLDIDNAVAVEVDAGDAVLFSQYLPHSSAASRSNNPRRAFRCAYKALDDAVIPRGTPLMVSRSTT